MLLSPSAVDELDWFDEDLVRTLHTSSGHVLDVISGHREHIVWRFFEDFYNNSAPTSYQSRVYTASRFSSLFTFPSFPGFVAHIPPFLLDIEKASRSTPGFDNTHHTCVSFVASILYHVVTVRHNLRLPSTCDDLIFLLAYGGTFRPAHLSAVELAALDGQLHRFPTMYEQAYASSVEGLLDTRGLPTESRGSLTRVVDTSLMDATIESCPIQCFDALGNNFTFPDSSISEPVETGISPPLSIPREFRGALPPSQGTARPRPRPTGRHAPPTLPTTALSVTLAGSPLAAFVPLVTIAPQVQAPAQRLTRSQAPKSDGQSISKGRGKRRKGPNGATYVWVDDNGEEVGSSGSDGT